MSLVLKHNESFYDMLLQEFLVLFDKFSHSFVCITIVGFILITCYVACCIFKYYCKKLTTEFMCKIQKLLETENIKIVNGLFGRYESILCHKRMLQALVQASEKCDKPFYAIQCIDIIVQCPQLINVKVNGSTPFHRICCHGNKSLIAFMLAKGADPNITTAEGENALCMAIYYFLNEPTEHDFSCLDMLVNAGCKLNFEDKYYNYLLKTAICLHNSKITQWLIMHQDSSTSHISRYSSTSAF